MVGRDWLSLATAHKEISDSQKGVPLFRRPSEEEKSSASIIMPLPSTLKSSSSSSASSQSTFSNLNIRYYAFIDCMYVIADKLEHSTSRESKGKGKQKATRFQIDSDEDEKPRAQSAPSILSTLPFPPPSTRPISTSSHSITIPTPQDQRLLSPPTASGGVNFLKASMPPNLRQSSPKKPSSKQSAPPTVIRKPNPASAAAAAPMSPPKTPSRSLRKAASFASLSDFKKDPVEVKPLPTSDKHTKRRSIISFPLLYRKTPAPPPPVRTPAVPPSVQRPSPPVPAKTYKALPSVPPQLPQFSFVTEIKGSAASGHRVDVIPPKTVARMRSVSAASILSSRQVSKPKTKPVSTEVSSSSTMKTQDSTTAKDRILPSVKPEVAQDTTRQTLQKTLATYTITTGPTISAPGNKQEPKQNQRTTNNDPTTKARLAPSRAARTSLPLPILSTFIETAEFSPRLFSSLDEAMASVDTPILPFPFPFLQPVSRPIPVIRVESMDSEWPSPGLPDVTMRLLPPPSPMLPPLDFDPYGFAGDFKTYLGMSTSMTMLKVAASGEFIVREESKLQGTDLQVL